MVEYYKLSFLKQVKSGASWEEFYLVIGGDKPEVHILQQTTGIGILNKKLERITKEDFRKNLDDSRRDSFG